ncbi:hypothetical protein ACWGKK_36610 [Streptomyces chartreusis]
MVFQSVFGLIGQDGREFASYGVPAVDPEAGEGGDGVLDALPGALLDHLEQAIDAVGASDDRGHGLDEGHGLISR